MPPRKTRDVRGRLESKFKFVPSVKGRATHHSHIELLVPGVGKIVTKFSHGETEIREHILGIMARELKVTGRQFAEMMDCTMTCEAYLGAVVDWARANGRSKPPKTG